MSSEHSGRIRSLTLDDARAYADMIVRSEEAWPWEMSGGVPYTEEIAREEIEAEGAIGQYVAEVGEKLIGVCTVFTGLSDESSAYIGFLNVEPDYHGKKFGKRLLRAGVDRAIEEGVDRVDLHTWPGNLKAVPLYKKMGFFWVPETSVYMVNSLPLVLRHPMFEDFFRSHPDWYVTQERDLSVEPDLKRRDGIRIYEYVFSSGDEEVRAVIDREGLWLTGGSNADVDIWIHPGNEICPEGLEQDISWEIRNLGDEALEGNLIVNPPESVEITERPPRRFRIEPDRELTLEGRFRIDPEADFKEEWQEPDRIESVLMIRGRTMRFRTGFGRKRALSFGYDPGNLYGYPGAETDLRVRMNNRTKLDLKGKVTVSELDEFISVTPKVHEFEVDPEGYAGFSCRVSIDPAASSRYLPLRFSPVILDENGDEVPLQDKLYHASSVEPGQLLVYRELDGKSLHMNNGLLSVSIDLLRGGRIVVRDGLSGEMLVTGLSGDALGPPFWPSEFEKARCEYSVQRHDGSATAQLQMSSKRHRGLVLLKEITLRTGSPVITVRYGLINQASEKRSLTLKASARSSLNHSRIYIPHRKGLISEKASSGYPRWTQDAPRKQRDFAENWVAFEGYKDRLFTVGSIWPAGVGDVELGGGSLAIPKMEIEVEGNHRAFIPEIHIYAGEGEWLGVREAWRRLARNSVDREKRYLEVRKRRPLSFGMTDNVVSTGGDGKGSVEISNLRGKRATGCLSVVPPDGWKASPREISFSELTWKTRRRKVRFRPERKIEPGVYEAEILLQTEGERRRKKVPIFNVGPGDVTVETTNDQGIRVISVENGTMRYSVCPSFGGTVYSLLCDGIEFLSSSFPESKPNIGYNPWYGGITGSLNSQESRGWQESFEAEPVNDGRWRGVETRVIADNHLKDIKGVVIRNRYLTTGSSNILRIEQEIENPTTAGMEVFTGAKVFPLLGAEDEMESVLPDDDGKPHARGAGDPLYHSSESGWVGVRNAELDRGMVFAGPSSNRAQLSLQRIRGMTLMTGSLKPYYPPGHSLKWCWHLAVCSSDLDQMYRHRHIRSLGPIDEKLY